LRRAYQETGLRKVLRRLKEEPLVPIGCILTVAAFTNAYRAMKRGDHHGVQRMFRARIAAQGFTVVAMVAGGMYYAEDRNKQKELWKLKEQQDAEEKREKWIKELEARDEEEKALKAMLEKRRKRAAERTSTDTGTEGVAAQARAAFRESKTAKQDAPDEETTETLSQVADEKTNSSGVLGSLGGWFGGSKKAPEDSTESTRDQKPDS
jgi:hypothetical protein